MDTAHFWEARAQRYAAEGEGLRAVCSFAMPRFYNWGIDLTQRAVLRSFIESVRPGAEVLDYGCGVGRWSREFASRGASVTAVDFSATMLSEASRRTSAAGLASHCSFIEADVANIELHRKFDLVFGVTVLQHLLDEQALGAAIDRLARHVRPGGRLIMVEAAPTRALTSCDTATFHARPLERYLGHLFAAGLEVQEIRGIDPLPLKLWLVPRFKRWPAPLARASLAIVTALSVPYDLMLSRWLTRHSWHKVIVATPRVSRP
jgi:2-polyprenyl-3-methyl-5-hydroxy-6-metoxy-1,4-benzoquinol methylase